MPTYERWEPVKRSGTHTARQQARAQWFGSRHHRTDGSPMTVPSLTSRRERRRVKNTVARSSRKANR